MRAKLLPFAAGLVVGIAATLVFHLVRPSTPTTSAVESQTSQLADKLAAAQKQVSHLEEQNAALASELDDRRAAMASLLEEKAPSPEGQSPGKSPFAAMFGGGGSGTNQFGEAMGKMMKVAMQQQLEMRMGALKSRLRLTDEQEQKVRALLEEQFGTAGEMATKFFQGKLTKEESEKLKDSATERKTELKDILTPEQQTEYEKYEMEQRQVQAQMVANMELMQIQQMIQLGPEQQDQVYDVLYAQTEEQLRATDGAMHVSADWEEQLNAKIRAIRAVLTPDQFATYEKFMESQREMFKAMMQSFTDSSKESASPSR